MQFCFKLGSVCWRQRNNISFIDLFYMFQQNGGKVKLCKKKNNLYGCFNTTYHNFVVLKEKKK